MDVAGSRVAQSAEVAVGAKPPFGLRSVHVGDVRIAEAGRHDLGQPVLHLAQKLIEAQAGQHVRHRRTGFGIVHAGHRPP